MRFATIDDNGKKRQVDLATLDEDQQDALLDQAVAVLDLTGPEPITERGGVVHRRGRPDPKAPSPRAQMKAEIAERRRQRQQAAQPPGPPAEGGTKPSGRTRTRKQ